MIYQRFILIIILFFQSVICYLDRACIASAATNISHDLAISAKILGLILGAFTVGYALFQIPAGWIADRFGARKALTWMVSAWSFFTIITGVAINAVQMLLVRLIFGAAEAGAFPSAAQAIYRWLPVGERGIAYGINFSGSRLGAAFALFFMPWLILHIGWRWSFVACGAIGIIWVGVWLVWFRDNPGANKYISQRELELLQQKIAVIKTTETSFKEVFTSLNMYLAMLQYFASNVTFYITLTWLPSYLQKQWPQNPNAIYFSAVPLIFAAFANWISGAMIMTLFQKGYTIGSRRAPAMIGFALGAIGLVLAAQTQYFGFLTGNESLYWFVLFVAIATLGVDMTISPSWAFCNDIGLKNSGAVAGTMNMAGNIGATLSIITFPFFINSKTGSAHSFFLTAAGINLGAIIIWWLMDPNRIRRKLSPLAVNRRFIAGILSLILFTSLAIGYILFTSF